MFKKTFKKINEVVEKGSNDIRSLVKKAEGFVERTDALIKSSDNSIKIIAGFVMVAMGMQILTSYTQMRMNMKMLGIMRKIK